MRLLPCMRSAPNLSKPNLADGERRLPAKTVAAYLEDRFSFHYSMRAWATVILVAFIALLRFASVVAVRLLVWQER